MVEVSIVKLPPDEWHRTLLMKSQHRVRWRLGAVGHIYPTIAPFHNHFPLAVSSLNNANLLICNNNQLTVVDQYFIILLLYKTMKVCGSRTKIYCVLCSKHMAHRAVCYNFPLVHDKPLGTPAYVRVVYMAYLGHTYLYIYMDIDGLTQGHNDSISNAQELLQSCTKPSI